MTQSTNLGLSLLPSSEYDTTLRKDYIAALSGPEATSNMQIIDTAVGALQAELNALEVALAAI